MSILQRAPTRAAKEPRFGPLVLHCCMSRDRRKIGASNLQHHGSSSEALTAHPLSDVVRLIEDDGTQVARVRDIDSERDFLTEALRQAVRHDRPVINTANQLPETLTMLSEQPLPICLGQAKCVVERIDTQPFEPGKRSLADPPKPRNWYLV